MRNAVQFFWASGEESDSDSDIDGEAANNPLGMLEVGCHFTATFDGADSNLVELDEDVHFLSPFPHNVLPGHTIRRDIRDHARRTTDYIDAVAVDFAAMIDFLMVCLYRPSINWIPSVRMDELWHILVKDRSYERMCGFMAALMGRYRTHNYVEHVKNDTRDLKLTHVIFSQQLCLMRSMGIQVLPGYMERSAAAGCNGNCSSVAVLVPPVRRASRELSA